MCGHPNVLSRRKVNYTVQHHHMKHCCIVDLNMYINHSHAVNFIPILPLTTITSSVDPANFHTTRIHDTKTTRKFSVCVCILSTRHEKVHDTKYTTEKSCRFCVYPSGTRHDTRYTK